jgi:hypothetical protein
MAMGSEDQKDVHRARPAQRVEGLADGRDVGADRVRDFVDELGRLLADVYQLPVRSDRRAGVMGLLLRVRLRVTRLRRRPWRFSENAATSAANARVISEPTGAGRGTGGRASAAGSAASLREVEFSRELRDDVLAGDITLSVRLWKRPQVKEGGRYRVGPGEIEVDAIELVPFAAITEADVRRAGEPDRETLRERAAHAGPIDDDTLVYRIELHAVGPGD